MKKCSICDKDAILHWDGQDSRGASALFLLEALVEDSVEKRHPICEECLERYKEVLKIERQLLFEKLHTDLNKLDRKIMRKLKQTKGEC